MDNRKSLFRDMIKTALDKDLNKTELQVFLVILMQTLGFGKASDPLTYGRIAHTMNKRKDHVKQSVKNVVTAGLFDAQKHPYFEFTYTIGVEFLLRHRGDFFTPTLPKTGEAYRKMEEFTENWEHTDPYLYKSLSKQLPTPAADSNSEQNSQKMPQAEIQAVEEVMMKSRLRASLEAMIPSRRTLNQSRLIAKRLKRAFSKKRNMTIRSTGARSNYLRCPTAFEQKTSL